MPRFEALVLRTRISKIYEKVTIEFEAENEDEAENKALDLAKESNDWENDGDVDYERNQRYNYSVESVEEC